MFSPLLSDMLVPIISIGATIVVAILAYVAQAIAKAGDMTVEIKRHAFLDPRDVRLAIRFYSTKKKTHEFHNFALAADIGGTLTTISDESLTPIAMEDEGKNLSTNGSGYRITIKEGATFDGVFHFVIANSVDITNIDMAYLIAVDKNGKTVKAAFELNTTDVQSIYFKKAKAKAKKQ